MQSFQHQRHAESRPPAPILRLESEEPLRGQASRCHALPATQRQLVPRQRPMLVTPETRQIEVEKTSVQEVEVQQLGERTEQQIQRVSQIHMSVFRDLSKYEQERASTKMMLEEKQRQLMETVKTAEQQKKNMIDLQLKCEKLSSMLQNEQTNQREIQHRISATKQLCGVLKEQANRLADSVYRGEGDRDELRLQERQQLDQHDELLTKFRDLDVSQRQKHDELKKQCDEQQIQLREQQHEYTTSMSSFQLKVLSLEAKCTEQAETVAVMATDLDQEQELSSSLQREKALLKEQLQKAETMKSSQDAKIKTLNQEIKENENEKSTRLENMNALTHKLRDAESQLARQALEYSQAEAQYQSTVRDREENMSLLTADLHNSHERVYSLESQLSTLHCETKDLRESLDNVHSQKLEADQFIAELLKKTDILELQIRDLSDQLSVVSKDREDALTEVNVLLAEKRALESKVVDLDVSMAGVVDKSALLEKELKSHSDLLMQKETIVSQLTCDLEIAHSNQRTTETRLNDLRRQQEKDSNEQSRVTKSLTETETEKDQLQAEVEGIRDALIDLKSELEASRGEEIDLRNQLEVALLENDQLNFAINEMTEEQNKARHQFGEQMKQDQSLIESLTQNLASANERANSLSGEMTVVQEKLHERSSYCSSLDSKVDRLVADKVQLESELSIMTDKLDDMNTQFILMRDQMTHTEQKVVALSEQKGEAVSSLRKAQQEFELQMNELCRTVEQYKNENQRTVEEKDRETAEIKQLRTEHDKEHLEVLDLRSRINTLANELKAADHAKASALDELSAGVEMVQQLKNQLEDKEKELQDLNQQLWKRLDPRPMTAQHKDCVVPSTPKPSKPNLRQATTPRSCARSDSSLLGNRPRGILKPASANTLHTGTQSKVVAFSGCASPTSSEPTEDGLVSPLSPPVPAKKAKSQPIREADTKSQCGKRQSSIMAPKSPRTPRMSPWAHSARSPSFSIPTNKARKDKAGATAAEHELTLFKELFPEADLPPTSKGKSPVQRSRHTPSSKLNFKKPKIRKSRKDVNEWNDSDSVFRFVDDD